MPDLPRPNLYTLTLFSGIVISIIYWSRVARKDHRLVLIYITALFSAFLGSSISTRDTGGQLFQMCQGFSTQLVQDS